MDFDYGQIVDRYKKYVIVHYMNDNPYYKIFDLEKKEFQKATYHNISKVVNGKLLTVDSLNYIHKPETLYRINIATQQKEDSVKVVDVSDVSTRENGHEDYTDDFYKIPFWNNINFVLLKDTLTCCGYHILTYDFKQKGVLYNAVQLEVDEMHQDENGNETTDKRVSLESRTPILKELILTSKDTLIKFGCSKPTINNQGEYLLTSKQNYLMNHYDVLVDLHGTIRYEIVFGNNLMDTIITRDRYSKIIDKYIFDHPKETSCINASLEYLPTEKLFNSYINTFDRSVEDNTEYSMFFYKSLFYNLDFSKKNFEK